MNPNARLYSPDAVATVRAGLTGTDLGTWTPDDEDPASDHTLDAREWETVRVLIDGGATSATLTPLIRAGAGGAWLALASLGALAPGAVAEVAVEGHFASFRVTAVTGSPLNIKVTGGRKRRNLAGG